VDVLVNEHGAAGDDGDAVVVGLGEEGEAAGDDVLAGGVDVALVGGVDGDGHAGVGDGVAAGGLGFAKPGPVDVVAGDGGVVFRGEGPVAHVAGELHEVEREIVSAGGAPGGGEGFLEAGVGGGAHEVRSEERRVGEGRSTE